MNDVGFVGLGHMGQPMARNLLSVAPSLLVWNRTQAKTTPLLVDGAQAASSLDDFFQRTRTVILMLENESAIDAVLGRGTDVFGRRVRDHTIVHMGTTSPAYSPDSRRRSES